MNSMTDMVFKAKIELALKLVREQIKDLQMTRKYLIGELKRIKK